MFGLQRNSLNEFFKRKEGITSNSFFIFVNDLVQLFDIALHHFYMIVRPVEKWRRYWYKEHLKLLVWQLSLPVY